MDSHKRPLRISGTIADGGGRVRSQVPGRSNARRRADRRAAVLAAAAAQDGVLARRELYRLGVRRWDLAAELRAGRWQQLGRQAVGVAAGGPQAAHWVAIFEVGADAALDGSTALAAAGLRHFEDVIHISVSHGTRHRRCLGVRVHETRRRRPGDVISAGLPRVRPEIAAIRAALWARSDRQAALVLAMSVQQRIVEPAKLREAAATVVRHRRRRLIRAVVEDVAGGAHSLGELDFARLCRRARLPRPDRQVVGQLPTGRVYLDCEFARYGCVVEIDGAGHIAPADQLSDALRQNELTIGTRRVLRIPLLGLRVAEEAFMEQVRRLLASAGWTE